ncbi:MAG: GNAT family N-acetyltransferase [Chitinophagales bacterium]
MTPITYQQTNQIPQTALLKLYNDAGWTAYTQNPEQLENAIKNSLYVLIAKEKDELVGLIRVIGDGFTIAYIQDILVLKAYKRRGIGTLLMKQMLENFSHIRQKVLLTDDNKETRGFYESLGFQSCDKGKLVSFAKLENS